MSMNILVEMKVASKTVFAKENRPLGVGEIAITKDLTDVRIGNGENKWAELIPLELPREVIEKWYNIATGTTSSHLVTLPDMNFAYTTINITFLQVFIFFNLKVYVLNRLKTAE